jgi:hypothetical protein
MHLVVTDAARTPLASARPVSVAEAREMSRPILEQYPYLKRSEPAPAPVPVQTDGNKDEPAGGAGLSPREMKVFARIAERPWELVQDRIDAVGLTREGEGEARRGFETRALAQLAGIVGAKNRLSELTARGREVAKAMGLTVAKPTKGSWVHEAIIQYTQRAIGSRTKARFQRTGISRTTGGVQPDLLMITPGGNRIPIQACCANQPAYEAAALLKLHELALLGQEHPDRVDFVLAVAVNKHHLEAVERALKRQNGGAMPGRLVLLDFDTVVSADFDPMRILEFPL